MSTNDVRSDVLELVDAEMVDTEYLITAMLNWMSQEDVREMLKANEIKLLDEIGEE